MDSNDIKFQKLKEYVNHCEREIQYLRIDLQSGWFAAVCLLIVLAITLYQWLVVNGGASCA